MDADDGTGDVDRGADRVDFGDDVDESADGPGDLGSSEGANTIDAGSVDALLERTGFRPDESVLTRRQAEVLVLRERGMKQSDIADVLGTSRANVSSVESSARENVEKARETVAFAEALTAPVRVEIPNDTDLYDVPGLVYDACDGAGVKVNHTAPELMKAVGDAAGDAVHGREIRRRLFVTVGHDGAVRVRRP
ncbi:Tfx family DNA-binding protein [Halopenitus sp. H-Gu1]|uniref:Tfx family DNA-binding protein n=1 Tax=Halopenitus sp. H-Gu1 TaxID=3242697 RepID=UPI00359EC5FE